MVILDSSLPRSVHGRWQSWVRPSLRMNEAWRFRIRRADGDRTMNLGELAKRLGCKLEGDASVEIHSVAGIDDAQGGQLTFLSNPKYANATAMTAASAVLIGKDVSVERGANLPSLALLRSSNPYLDFARALEIFYQPPQYAPGIHATAVVSAKARVGEGAHIGPYCFVDDGAEIGKNA